MHSTDFRLRTGKAATETVRVFTAAVLRVLPGGFGPGGIGVNEPSEQRLTDGGTGYGAPSGRSIQPRFREIGQDEEQDLYVR